jgi:uncharacterized damage-inducible protein DinB
MGNCSLLADDNIGYLQQGIDLLNSLDDATYTRATPSTYGNPLGGHLRHCLDHYTNFLAGLAAGQIDYDARQRDPKIESDRTFAVQKMKELVRELKALKADSPLQVKMDCGDESDEASWWSESTVRRELQFLVSHTVHHYALIKLILKFQGQDTGPAFGVAPSTLRYNESQKACAR